jgi:hypothetical protein
MESKPSGTRTLSDLDVSAVAEYLVAHYRDRLQGREGKQGLHGCDGRIGKKGADGANGASAQDVCQLLATPEHGKALTDICWPHLEAGYVKPYVHAQLSLLERDQLTVIKHLQAQLDLLRSQLEEKKVLPPLSSVDELQIVHSTNSLVSDTVGLHLTCSDGDSALDEVEQAALVAVASTGKLPEEPEDFEF